MREDDQSIRQRVDITRLQNIYRATPGNLVATAVVALAFAGVMATVTSWEPLATWLGVLGVVLVGRAINAYNFRRRSRLPGGRDLSRWWRRHRLGVLATGLVLGCSTLVNFEHVPVAYQIFSIFVLAGLAAGALTVMILDQVSYRLYLSTMMLPAAVVFAWYHDPLHLAISVMILVYVVVLIGTSSQLHRKVLQSLTLGYEKRELAERLKREKERLDSRLGRILNDSSNEIFVVDAQTLRCMQVNQGALEHLGYTEREITRLRLTDIIDDLSDEDLHELIRPLVTGREESVFYHGYHRRRNGERYPVEIRFQYSAQESPPVLVATALDMTERDKVRRQLIHQANFDQLTDLPNRFSMLGRLEQAFHHARRHGTLVALLYLDLDDFKKVNDTLGHAAGDTLLQQAADRLRSVLRDTDTPSRVGGDEFMVMLEGLRRRSQALRVAEKLVAAFERPFIIGPAEIYTGVSIGISLFPEDGHSVEELMQYADIAMYQAKQQGGGQWRSFDHGLLQALEERLEMESALRRAIGNGEMVLHYQPKVDAMSGCIVGAEALLRWESPVFGRVPPDRFIPLAENLGLIGEIGRWVLREACREATKWPTTHDLHVAVNVSPHQFRNGRLVEEVLEALDASGLPPERLELEITESLLLQDSNQALETLEKLRGHGLRLSLDDFGTGYSSLAYLKRFPLQTLKIDRCFIRDMNQDTNAQALVKAIISMARALDLKIVAEGVEDATQLEFLRAHGVRIIQGYFFSPPVSATAFQGLLRRCIDPNRREGRRISSAG